MGVNSVGAGKRRADGVMSGWRECLDLICVAVLATAGLMLVLVFGGPHAAADKLSVFFSRQATGLGPSFKTRIRSRVV